MIILGENQEEERYRRPTRAKPIMIPVDQPPPPRERKKLIHRVYHVYFSAIVDAICSLRIVVVNLYFQQ